MTDLVLIDKPILDLTPLLTNPILTEVSLALVSFISICLSLWLMSKVLYFKKHSLKIALKISAVVALISFLIRLTNFAFILNNVYSNVIAMIVAPVLLFFLIKKTYKEKLSETIWAWIGTIGIGAIIASIIIYTLLFFFTTVMQNL